MKKYEHIPYPTEEQIDEQIRHIVTTSLPKKKSLFTELRALYSKLGWTYVLPNRYEWGLIMLTVFILFLVINNAVTVVSIHSITFIFMLSPVLFASLSIYHVVNKNQTNTFELEMTTKITVFQLIAAKLIVFSGLTMLMNTTLLCYFAYLYDMHIMKIWFISTLSVLLFVSGLLFTVAKGRIVPKILGYSGVWLVVSGSLFYLDKAAILWTLPSSVYILSCIVLLGICYKGLNNLYFRKQEGMSIC